MDRYAFTAQLTSLTPVGIAPAGLRMDVGFAGQVTDGPLAGAAVTGIDYLLIRADGVAVIDARELVVASDGGATLALHAEGYIVPPFPMPPLAELLRPGFAWPDVDLALHGSVRGETAAPDLESVNRTVFGFTGAVNLATGRLQVTARSLAPAPALQAG